MVVHIVLFEFKEENKKENILKIKELLEKLENKIEVLKTIEVGINFDKAPRAMDLSLYSTFDSIEDLNAYAIHPEHLKVVEKIKEVTLSSKVSDYII